jgi:hypothetical protein
MNKRCKLEVLLLIGCYKGEVYGADRASFLKRSLEDLAAQTFKPCGLIVSINSNLGGKSKSIRDMVLTCFPGTLFFESSFDRSAILNFEALVQLSSAEYLCFWSDHDIHHPGFLHSCVQAAESSRCSLVCPEITYFYSDDGSVARAPSCSPYFSSVNFSPSRNLEDFFKIDSMGAVYGLWRSCDLKRLPFIDLKSLDFLWQAMAQLMAGCAFIGEGSGLLLLREYRHSRGSNHSQLVQSISPFAAFAKGLKFSTAIAVLINWIHENIESGQSRRSLLRVVRQSLFAGVGFWNIKRPLLREALAIWSIDNKQKFRQKIISTLYVFDVMASLK